MIGSATRKIDHKGRVAIPLGLRKAALFSENDPVVICKAVEKCLYIYPYERWTKMLMDDAQENEDKRLFLRALAQKQESSIVEEGWRLSIPPRLLRNAGISTSAEVLFLGVLDHIEIWDPAEYQRYMYERDANIDSFYTRGRHE